MLKAKVITKDMEMTAEVVLTGLYVGVDSVTRLSDATHVSEECVNKIVDNLRRNGLVESGGICLPADDSVDWKLRLALLLLVADGKVERVDVTE